MKTVIGLLCVMTSLAMAADPPGFHVWKSADLKGFQKTLSAKINDQKLANQMLSTEGNHSFQVAHREGTGQSESHDKFVDVVVVETGEATLAYGGEIVEAQTVQPGEVRGTSIRGGTEVPLRPGDVVHIPAKVPHQMKVAPGKEVTYFVVKIAE